MEDTNNREKETERILEMPKMHVEKILDIRNLYGFCYLILLIKSKMVLNSYQAMVLRVLRLFYSCLDFLRKNIFAHVL